MCLQGVGGQAFTRLVANCKKCVREAQAGNEHHCFTCISTPDPLKANPVNVDTGSQAAVTQGQGGQGRASSTSAPAWRARRGLEGRECKGGPARAGQMGASMQVSARGC